MTGDLGNARMTGIIKEVAPCAAAESDEELGVKDFEGYFPYQLYHDEDLEFYKFLGNRRVSISSLAYWNPLKIYDRVKKIGRQIRGKNITGNFRGSGLILGGVIVYSTRKGVIYQYGEVLGSELPREEIKAAVKKAYEA